MSPTERKIGLKAKGRCLLPLAILMIFGSTDAIARTVSARLTGNQLLEACTRTDHPGWYAQCLAYVIAVADVLAGDVAVEGYRACVPEAQNQQLVDVAKQWLELHPETRHYPAHILVAQSLAESFPCQ